MDSQAGQTGGLGEGNGSCPLACLCRGHDVSVVRGVYPWIDYSMLSACV